MFCQSINHDSLKAQGSLLQDAHIPSASGINFVMDSKRNDDNKENLLQWSFGQLTDFYLNWIIY